MSSAAKRKSGIPECWVIAGVVPEVVRSSELPLSVVGEVFCDGEESGPQISAASILAKTARDAEMLALHQRFPLYGFDQHKGYPTKKHIAALQAHGVSSVHRRSFAPVKAAIKCRD